MGDRAHTILLVQHGPSKNSRTFMDYETVTLAMDGEAALRLIELIEWLPGLSRCQALGCVPQASAACLSAS